MQMAGRAGAFGGGPEWEVRALVWPCGEKADAT